MKLKVAELLNSIPAIQKIMTQNLSGSASFRMARNSKEIDRVIEDFNQTVQKLNELSDITEDEKRAQFEEILNDDIELNIVPLKEESIDELKLTPAEVLSIMFLFE